MSTSTSRANEDQYQISESGLQLLNWCRELAVLDQRQFYTRYSKLSKTALKQLSSIPAINQQPEVATFPWIPPSAPVPFPQATPSPELQAAHPNLPIPPRRRAKRRRDTDYETTEGSNDSYYPPNGTSNAPLTIRLRDSLEGVTLIGSNPPERAITPTIVPNLNHNHFEDIKELLTRFAVSKIYQRHSNGNSSKRQPHYETSEFHRYSNTFGNEEEEACSELFIKVKNNLALALESESRANFYYYKMALNLVQLQDRMKQDVVGFQDMLRGLNMGTRYVEYYYASSDAHVICGLFMFKRINLFIRNYLRYKSYYLFVTRYQRFKYCTLSFTAVTKNISKLKNWFDSDECTELPTGNILSRGFWMSEPIEYHNFDSIMCLDEDFSNDDEITDEQEDIDSEDQLSEEMEISNSLVVLTEEQRENARGARIAAIRLRRSMEESGIPILPEFPSPDDDQISQSSTSSSDPEPRSDIGVRF